MDLHLSISDGFVKIKINDKRDDFDFDIVDFPFCSMFLARHPMVFIFLNLFDLVSTANFSDKDIDIINFVRRFQNFIGGILT